jgi:hypothetical protein
MKNAGMKRAFTLMLTLAAAAPLAAEAYTYDGYNGNYDIMGCASFTVTKENTRGWLIGYLTALDNSRNTYVMQDANLPNVFRLFDGYCRANPNRSMNDAANFTFRALGGR